MTGKKCNKAGVYMESRGVRILTVNTVLPGLSKLRKVLRFFLFFLKSIVQGLHVETKPSVVIGSTIDPLAALAGFLISRYYQVPFIYEVRDIWPLTLIEFGAIKSTSVMASALRSLDLFLFKRARLVLTPLQYLNLYYSELDCKVEKIRWIPNGATIRSAADRQTLQSTNNASREAPIFCYFGSLGNANGIKEIILGYSLFASTHKLTCSELWVIGDGELKEDLKEMVNRQNIPNVKFIPHAQESTLDNLFKKVSAFMVVIANHPRLYKYGLGLNKLPRCLNSGKPIIYWSPIESDPLTVAKAGIRCKSGKTVSESISMGLEDYVSSSDELVSRCIDRGVKLLHEVYDNKKISELYRSCLLEVCHGASQ